jgi:hypothetical protein
MEEFQLYGLDKLRKIERNKIKLEEDIRKRKWQSDTRIRGKVEKHYVKNSAAVTKN